MNILISTEDNQYAEALAESLTRNTTGVRVDIKHFTSGLSGIGAEKTERANSLSGNELIGYDVILTDMPEEAEAYVSAGENVILLAETSDAAGGCGTAVAGTGPDERCLNEESPNENGLIVRFKYGSIKEIAQTAALLCLESRSGKRVVERSETKGGSAAAALKVANDTDIYLFVSLYGGCGCSAIAYSFAESLSLEQQKRVLYVNSAPFGPGISCVDRSGDVGAGDTAGTAKSAGIAGRRDLRRYLYHMYEKKDVSQTIGSYLVEGPGGVMLFREPLGISPLAGIGDGEAEGFLGSIIKSRKFDAVIFDAGSHFSLGTKAVAQYSKTVFLVMDERKLPETGMRFIRDITDNKRMVTVMNGQQGEAVLREERQRENGNNDTQDSIWPDIYLDISGSSASEALSRIDSMTSRFA